MGMLSKVVWVAGMLAAGASVFAAAGRLNETDAAYASQGALPDTIDPRKLGDPSFHDDFQRPDFGTDQIRPARPHRWRTVHGAGGALSPDNRSLSASSLAVDREFAGIDGRGPIGIDPFSTDRDGLTITARRVGPDLANRLFGREWASGLLTTKFSFSQLYGYFEADMDLPGCVKGAWPAFWLLPVSGKWPEHGEIDAPETFGNGKVYWTVIAKAPAGKVDNQQTTPGTCTRGWHRYGVLWRPDVIGFYYDRKLVAKAATPKDYTVPMFLLLDLAVGGKLPGPPEPGTRTIAMKVREVSAWKVATPGR